jgi:hypothetical protein
MHRDHDHGEHHHHAHDHHHDHAPAVGPGHNHPRSSRNAAQWQTPHLGGHHAPPSQTGETDLDQVEAAFIEGFTDASDPTSFLRLANIPFESVSADGTKLRLLRVETNVVADVGSLTPHLGGGSFRYDPLPAPMVSRRRRLRFVYFGGTQLRSLKFNEVRELPREPR